MNRLGSAGNQAEITSLISHNTYDQARQTGYGSNFSNAFRPLSPLGRDTSTDSNGRSKKTFTQSIADHNTFRGSSFQKDTSIPATLLSGEYRQTQKSRESGMSNDSSLKFRATSTLGAQALER